jgi:hypothetical protein
MLCLYLRILHIYLTDMTTAGRKIPPAYENPIDNLLIASSEHIINPILFSIGFTANTITVLSFITGLIMAWYIFKGRWLLGAVWLGISYWLDCADGNFARKYNQVSAAGDMFDHISDATKYTLLYVGLLLSRKITRQQKAIIVGLTVSLAYLTLTHFGCQERIYDSDESDSLHMLRGLCWVDHPERAILWTRWFGSGTWHLVMIALMLWLAKSM